MKKLKVVEKTSKQINLEEKLIYLQKFGCPRLSYLDYAWHARIEMRVTNGKHVNYTIASDYTHSSPIQAIDVLIERIETQTSLTSLTEG